MTLPITSTTLPAGADHMQPSGAYALGEGDIMFRGTSYGVWLSGFSLVGLNAAWARLAYHMQFQGTEDWVLAGSYRPPFLMGGAPAYGAQVYGATTPATSWRQPGSEYAWGGLLADLRATYAAAAPGGGELGATAWVWDSNETADNSTTNAVQNAAERAIQTAGNAGQAVLSGVQGVTQAATGALNAGANALNGAGTLGNALGSLNPVVAFVVVAALVAGGVYLWRELK